MHAPNNIIRTQSDDWQRNTGAPHPKFPTMAGIQLLYIFNIGGDGLAKGRIKDEVLT